MARKLSQISIVLTFISVTTQLSLVKQNDENRLHHGLDFIKVKDHLDTHSSPHHHKAAHSPANLLNIQNLNLYLNPPKSQDRKDDNGDDKEKLEELLDELENQISKDNLLRCPNGDRCGKDLRKGDRCACGRSDDRDDDSLRCANGERCGKDLRCGCGRSGDKEKDSLRCDNDDECGKESEEDECGCGRSDNRDGKGLRCANGERCGKDLRCGCGPSDNREDDSLRCANGERCGKDLRCGCSRSDDRDGDDLTCANGERCGKDLRCGCGRSDDNDDEDRCGCGGRGIARSEQSLKSELERYGKKFKINDELDAIVLDLAKFNGLLGKLNNRNGNSKKQNRISTPDLDMDYYFSLDEDRKEKNGKFDLMDAFVIDLGDNDDDGRDDSDESSFQSKVAPLKPDFATLFGAKKQNIISKPRNAQSGQSSNSLSHLTQKLRDILLKSDSDSNYPRRLTRSLNPPKKKSLLPMTVKQKLKLKNNPNTPPQRRAAGQNREAYGVPFELQVEGLGQLIRK